MWTIKTGPPHSSLFKRRGVLLAGGQTVTVSMCQSFTPQAAFSSIFLHYYLIILLYSLLLSISKGEERCLRHRLEEFPSFAQGVGLNCGGLLNYLLLHSCRPIISIQFLHNFQFSFKSIQLFTPTFPLPKIPHC